MLMREPFCSCYVVLKDIGVPVVSYSVYNTKKKGV